MFDQPVFVVNVVSFALILLLYLQPLSLEAYLTNRCPIGFKRAYTSTGEEMCYILKNAPENFPDKFKNCTGNLFTWSLYNSLNITKNGTETIWTDFKSLYPGGPFIDWSYSNTTGDLLKTTYDVNREFVVNNDDEYCVIVDPSLNEFIPDSYNQFKAVSCRDEEHYRYCFLKPNDIDYHGNNDCKNFTNGVSCIVWEKPVPNITLSLAIESSDDLITLTVNDTISKEDILCFTDSTRYYPQRETVKQTSSNPYIYTLKPSENGYYWCTHKAYNTYAITESNHVLFVKVKEHTKNLYAVQIRTLKPYKLSIASDFVLLEDWKNMLDDYVFYSNVYIELNNISNCLFRDSEVWKNSHGSKTKDIVKEIKLKRLYLDARTVLLHVELHPDMKQVCPGMLNDIEIEDVKPVYFCDKDLDLTLGMNCTSDRKVFQCSGDYNAGVASLKESDMTPTSCINIISSTTSHTSTINVSTVSTPVKTDYDATQVFIKLEKLVYGTKTITVDDIRNVLVQVDFLLKNKMNIHSKLLQLLDKLGARVDLNGSVEEITVRDNIAMVVAESPHALRIARRKHDAFVKEAFKLHRDTIPSGYFMSENSEVVVELPKSTWISQRRVSFVVFRDNRAFFDDGVHSINSLVVGVSIENITTFTDNEKIDINLQPFRKSAQRNQSHACAYWHFEEDDSARWSQDGCFFVPSNDSVLLKCSCNHLTHFAEILVPKPVFSEENKATLEIITVVGCCISIVGLLMVGLTGFLFRSWRRDYSNKVWLQLCASIFLLSVIFLVVVFGPVRSGALCTVTGVALHYAVLASFCWMLVAAVLSYRRLVMVFTRDASHKLLRAAAFAWGSPCAVIAVLLLVNPHAYEAPYEEQAPNATFCYPSGLALWLTVYSPIAIMLLANWILFILIFRSVFVTKKIQRHGDTNEALRCASVSCLLVFLFGLPWIFGLFSFNVVAAYFFSILATFQGFVLFLCLILGNKNTRDLWLSKMKIKETRTPFTSSTYTNKSAGVACNSRHNKTPVGTRANVIKPKLLIELNDLDAREPNNGRFC